MRQVIDYYHESLKGSPEALDYLQQRGLKAAAGFRNVTSSYGTAGFTDELLEAFKAHGIERVLIAYDRDDAGNAAAVKLSEKLKGEGPDCFRILFPKGMDANEYALKVQPAAKSLGLAIRKAEWMGAGTAPSVTTRSATGAETVDSNEVADAVSAEDDLPLAASAAVHPPTTASPLPSAPVSPADAVGAEQRERETVIVLGDRRYRVRGLEKNLSFDQLKVNLLVTCAAGDAEASSRGDRSAAFHVDTLDLYSARHRGVYVKQAALELSVEERLIRHDLARCSWMWSRDFTLIRHE